MARQTLQSISEVWAKISSMKNFSSSFNKMVITAASEKSIQAEFTVTEEMANPVGNLHGGASATIADLVSSLGLMLGPHGNPGVSVNLNMNYLKAAKIGDQIVVYSETLKSGKTLAYLDIKLKKKDTGELIATCFHIKHVSFK